MPLVELDSPEAVHDFLAKNPTAIITFSATWCGPCQHSRPALQALAESVSTPMAIVHEDDLDGDLDEWNVSGFPTHIAFQSGKEVQRVVGANIPAVKAMVESLAS